MTRAELYRFMSSQTLAVLGTVSASGLPQSALVGVAVNAELEIVFDTVDSSRKFQNLTANSRCSLVLGWASEITVQYEGEARRPAGPALAKYQETYFASWPECRSHLEWPGIAFFAVRPRWIRYSDFNCRPPFIEEFAFAPARSATGDL